MFVLLLFVCCWWLCVGGCPCACVFGCVCYPFVCGGGAVCGYMCVGVVW